MGKKVEDQKITINVPFTYYIGEEGPVTGKIINTVEDCMNEVKEEIRSGNLSNGDIFMKVVES